MKAEGFHLYNSKARIEFSFVGQSLDYSKWKADSQILKNTLFNNRYWRLIFAWVWGKMFSRVSHYPLNWIWKSVMCTQLESVWRLSAPPIIVKFISFTICDMVWERHVKSLHWNLKKISSRPFLICLLWSLWEINFLWLRS